MAKYRSTPDQSSDLPPGIPYIIGNEFAERFSFYGMKGILTVFMTQHLLNRAGEPAYMNDEDAKAIYHLFTAAAYFLPRLPQSLFDQAMALPYHLYVISTSGTFIEKSRPMAYGTAVVLLVLVLLLNLSAVLLRNRLQKKVGMN